MTTPYWFDEANVAAEQSLWDQVVLGDVLLPGLARVEVTKGAARKVDVRSAAGANGARLVEKGVELVAATIALRLWEPEHWAEWERHSLALTRRVRESLRRTAMPIAHPVLAALSVTSVYVTEVGGLKQESVGIWGVELHVIEYRPPTATATRAVLPWAPPATPPATTAATDQTPAWQRGLQAWASRRDMGPDR